MQQHLRSRPGQETGQTRPAVFPYGRTEHSSHWPATPGAATCPDCGATAIDAQGLLDCPDCDWFGRRDAE